MEEVRVGVGRRCCSVCKSRIGPMSHFPKRRDRRDAWEHLLGLELASDYGQICVVHFRGRYKAV